MQKHELSKFSLGARGVVNRSSSLLDPRNELRLAGSMAEWREEGDFGHIGEPGF